MGHLIKDYNTVISSTLLVCLFVVNMAWGSTDMFWFHPYTIFVWVLILFCKNIKSVIFKKSVLIVLWPYFSLSAFAYFLCALGVIDYEYIFSGAVDKLLNCVLAISVFISVLYGYKASKCH